MNIKQKLGDIGKGIKWTKQPSSKMDLQQNIYLKPTGRTDAMDLQQNRTWSKMDLQQNIDCLRQMSVQ